MGLHQWGASFGVRGKASLEDRLASWLSFYCLPVERGPVRDRVNNENNDCVL